MNNENTHNSTIAFFALVSLMMATGETHAQPLYGWSTKPTLQDTVLRSPSIFTQIQSSSVKLYQISHTPRTNIAQKSLPLKKVSLIGGLTKGLKNHNFSDIYFTKKTGQILEAEACKNNNRYFLQLAPDGDILQATRFDSCISPTEKPNIEKKSAPSAPDQKPVIAISIAKDRISKPTIEKKPLNIVPQVKTELKLINSQSLLARRGYKHIYAPKRASLGIMACKNGVEYSFKAGRKVTEWSELSKTRKALGKCFGYGKQILNLNNLLTIMRRHGDTKIRIVRGNLPLFEAYSCLKGERRHVKINRWGNDQVRKVGKCS